MAMDIKGYFGVYKQQYNSDLVESSRDEIYELQQENEYLRKTCQHLKSLQNCYWNCDQKLTQKKNPVHIYQNRYPEYQFEELQDEQITYSLHMHDKDSVIETLHQDIIKQNHELDASRRQFNNEKQTNEERTCIILDLQRKLQQQERDNKRYNGHDEEISRLRKELENCKNNQDIQKSLKPLEQEKKLYTEEEQNELALAYETIHKMQAKIKALPIELASKRDEAVDTGNKTKQLFENSMLLNKQNHDLTEMSQYPEKERECLQLNMHQFKEKFDSVSLNNEILRKEFEEMKNQHQKLNDESRTLRSELHSEQDQNADLQKKIATMSQENDLYKTRFKIETVEQSQKSNSMRNFHEEKHQHKAAVDALAAENEHLKTQILKANADLKELQNKNAHAADFCQMESEAQMTALKEILIQNQAGSTFPSL
ncbi:hypothetical protein MAR_023935, partial [Mya arenaria]